MRSYPLLLALLLVTSPPNEGTAFVTVLSFRHCRYQFSTTTSTTSTSNSFNTLNPDVPPLQISHFLREGHCCIRHLLSKEEIDQMKPLIVKAFDEEKLEALRHEVRVFFGDKAYKKCKTVEVCEAMLKGKDAEDITPFLQVFNLWRTHETIQPIALSKRIAHVAAQLLGVPRVRLYQDSLFVKRPGDDRTLYHSDLATAPLDTNDFITAWISLTPIPSINEGGSPLSFASTSHLDLAWSYWMDPHYDPSNEEEEDPIEARYTWKNHAPMALGDVTFHHGWCLHGSPPNPLPESRIALTLAYVSADATTLPEDTIYLPDPEDQISYEDWVGEVGAGQVIDHPLVPVVYDEEVDR